MLYHSCPHTNAIEIKRMVAEDTSINININLINFRDCLAQRQQFNYDCKLLFM